MKYRDIFLSQKFKLLNINMLIKQQTKGGQKMLNQLIKVEVNERQEQVVSGRELHRILEVRTEYLHWIERRVGDGCFVEGVDYILVGQKRQTNNPKNPFTEYADHILKLGMAKELCMLERNDKGKQARQYFIQVEKDWNSPEKVMARALIIAGGKLEHLKAELQEAERRAEARERSLMDALSVLEGAAARIVKEVAVPKPRRNRRHYRVCQLPLWLRRSIDRHLDAGTTYAEIIELVADEGYRVALSSLGRYNYARVHTPELLRNWADRDNRL
jgi:phage anti-repressor protein